MFPTPSLNEIWQAKTVNQMRENWTKYSVVRFGREHGSRFNWHLTLYSGEQSYLILYVINSTCRQLTGSMSRGLWSYIHHSTEMSVWSCREPHSCYDCHSPVGLTLKWADMSEIHRRRRRQTSYGYDLILGLWSYVIVWNVSPQKFEREVSRKKLNNIPLKRSTKLQGSFGLVCVGRATPCDERWQENGRGETEKK